MRANNRTILSGLIGIFALFSLGTLALAALPDSDDPDLQSEGPIIDWPAPSPDGTNLLFVSDASGKPTIWSASAKGQNIHPLIKWLDSIQTEPDWGRDGNSIVFTSNRGGKNFNIWIAKSDGSNPMQLTSESRNNMHPRISEDGKKIVFTSNRTGKRELWTMNLDGSDQKNLGLQAMKLNDPAWSPDSKAVVYTGCEVPAGTRALTDLGCNIYTVTADTFETKQISRQPSMDEVGDWGIDGILGSSLSDGLFSIDPTSTAMKQITNGKGLDMHPRWDRADHTVIFVRQKDNPAIWSIDKDGKEVELIGQSDLQ